MDLQNRKCCDSICEFSRMFNINTLDCNLEKLMVCATKMHYHLCTQFMNTISHAKLKNSSNLFLREIIPKRRFLLQNSVKSYLSNQYSLLGIFTVIWRSQNKGGPSVQLQQHNFRKSEGSRAQKCRYGTLSYQSTSSQFIQQKQFLALTDKPLFTVNFAICLIPAISHSDPTYPTSSRFNGKIQY